MPSVALPSWPGPTDCVPSSDLDVVGTWEGAVRDFSFAPIVALRLEILGASEDGGACGTLTWGDRARPQPPTDPDGLYPNDRSISWSTTSSAFLYEGAVYTLMNGLVTDAQLRFHITGTELWKEWCMLQTPYPDTSGYRCMPGYNTSWEFPDEASCRILPEDGPPFVVGRTKCAFCPDIKVCVCNADGCTANPESAFLGFDLVLDGDRIWGKLTENSDLLVGEWTLDPVRTDVLLTRVE